MAAFVDFIRRIVVSELRGETDADLIGRFLTAGDEAAFMVIVNRHGPMVYRVCRSVLGNRDDAEDSAQATFLVLARKASRLRKHDSLASWLHGVAFRTSRKLRVAIARRRARETLPVAMRSSAADLTVREAGEIVHEELEKLPTNYKVPLVLCYLQGKTHDEAAVELGWSITAFRGRLERARNQLRDKLSRRGLGLSTVPLTGILAEVQSSLPPMFAVTMARASVTMARAAVARGLISATASHLAQEIFRSMSITYLKFAWPLVVATVLATCGWLALHPAPAAQPPVESKATPSSPETKDDGATKPHPEDSPSKILVSRYDRFAKLKADHSGLSPFGGELDDAEFFYRHRTSPDGKSVAFQHQTRVGMVLSIWKFDQPWPGKVAATAFLTDFFWMPDGKHLVLSSWGGHKDGLPTDFKFSLLDVATLKVADLKLPEGHWVTDVSPDGKWFLTMKIVDPKDGKTGAKLYRVASATGKAELLFDKVTIMVSPLWRFSPDGKQVAGLQISDDRNLQVAVGDLSGGPLRLVTREATGVDGFFGWSPSGKKLLYRFSREPAKPKADEIYHDFVVAIGTDGRNREELYKNERHFNAKGQHMGVDGLSWADWR